MTLQYGFYNVFTCTMSREDFSAHNTDTLMIVSISLCVPDKVGQYVSVLKSNWFAYFHCKEN